VGMVSNFADVEAFLEFVRSMAKSFTGMK